MANECKRGASRLCLPRWPTLNTDDFQSHPQHLSTNPREPRQARCHGMTQLGLYTEPHGHVKSSPENLCHKVLHDYVRPQSDSIVRPGGAEA